MRQAVSVSGHHLIMITTNTVTFLRNGPVREDLPDVPYSLEHVQKRTLASIVS